MIRTIVNGAIAGAAGEAALNVLTYLDMLVRARPPSAMPGKVADRLADAAGIELAQPGERPDKHVNRREAGGALLGYVMAIGMAVLYAVARRLGVRMPLPVAGIAVGGAAMFASDATATGLGVTDPTTWGAAGWAADIVPHLGYGIVTAAVLEFLDD